MKRIPVLFAFVFLALSHATGTTVSNIAELVRLTLDKRQPGISFVLEGVVTYPPAQSDPHFAIENECGRIALRGRPFWTNGAVRVGDFIRAHGTTVTVESFGPGRDVSPNCYTIETLSRVKPKDIPLVGLADVRSGKYDYSPVHVRGTIRDFFRDEIDPAWIFLVLTDDRESVYCAFVWTGNAPSDYEGMIGSQAEISALVTPKNSGCRRFLGRHLNLHGMQDIHVLKATQGDPFDVPDIAALRTKRAAEIAVLGRHKAVGRVIATWEENRLLLRTSDGETVRVILTEKRQSPKVGDIVEVSGLPETELFNINLARAAWRPTQAKVPPEPPATPVRAEDLIADIDGSIRINTRLHGNLIRLTGTVRETSSSHQLEKLISLSGGPITVQVDVNAAPQVLDIAQAGSKVEITGICRIETDSTYPDSAFPHVKGLTVMLRTEDDLRILKRPPWWTPQRLMIAIAALFSLLLGVLVWNVLLRRVSDRKGHALAKASIAKAASELKLHERTRLATELHDSIVQSLTGVSMELRAVTRLSESNRPEADHQFNLALKTLDSCRGELRNCIWDLRNRALDDPTMDTALVRTLSPHTEDAKLTVRFAVARRRLTDNTAHALINIIRELVINAVRHGHAKTIMVAGCVDNGLLRFSVRDNGVGFDTANAPGADAGHFGIQGIRERIDALHGSLKITSAPGNGTKATIVFPIADEGKQ